MDAQQQQIQTLFQRLGNAYNSLMRSGRANQVQRNDPLWLFMNEVGQIVNAYSALPKQASDDARRLIALADRLDAAGAHAMADVVDEAAADMANLTGGHSRCGSLAGRMLALAQELDDGGDHVRADVLDRAAAYVRCFAEEEKPAVKPMNETPLSTRYCPDHVGVQTARISDSTVQCPLDGRMYNYETGYSDYEGQRVPGGSVAAQTPDVTPYGIPNRLYDSRQNVINTMN